MISHQDLVLFVIAAAGVMVFALAATVGVAWMIMYDRRRTEHFMIGVTDRMLVRNYNELVAGTAIRNGTAPIAGSVKPLEENLDQKALDEARKRAIAEADAAMKAAKS